MKLNPIPQRNSTNRASIILYNNTGSFTISFMKFSVYEWSVAHATDYNLTRVIGLELRVEGKKRGCFHLDCRKEMPNWMDPNWPIYASQRAVRYYWPCKKRHLAELTSRFDTSKETRLHETKMFNLLYWVS